jgi:hypothetical protein
MNKYDEMAERLQRSVRSGEVEVKTYYEQDQVNQAVVHGREDIVLMVSYLASLNKQIRISKYILIFILATLLAIYFE